MSPEGRLRGGQSGKLEERRARLMRPLSRGCVKAKSCRPVEMPAINPRYLSQSADQRAIIVGWATVCSR